MDDFGISEEDIHPDARLEEDLSMDSLDMVEMLMAAEEAFKIEIPDGDAVNIKTIGEAVKYIESKLA